MQRTRRLGEGGQLRPCLSVCVCAIIVLTAFGQFSAAFLGGQRDAMTAVAATQLVAAVAVALSAPASTPI